MPVFGPVSGSARSCALFLLLGTLHDLADRGARILLAAKDRIDLLRNWELNFVPARQREQGPGRIDTFGDAIHFDQNFAERSAPRQFHSDVPVSAQHSLAGQDEGAENSEGAQRLW